ncbi:iron-hydroxamate ABC transporter substrate-binding protein [Oceanobacillus kapialis]|uniref:iron-hydroxamate ABC transporter substrate-binding protein n=1 Tax=Oceanobacillus kapialis TaxID=481353 RepID=UPI00384E329D
MNFNKKLVLAGILFVTLLLAACGESDNAAEDNGDTSTEQEQNGTRTITDAVGNEVEVPANPQNVIASYLEDYLVALDITPVAQWSVRDGEDVQDYLQDDLGQVPTIPSDLPYEAVASFEPDLLIMDSAEMVEGNKYEQYSKIAPTYVVGEAQNNEWREELKDVAKVFAKEEEAEQILTDYEEKATNAKEEISSAIGSESAAALWLFNDTFYIVNENLSSGDVLYNDLGLTAPNVVQEISGDTVANWSEISLEKLAELDADHIFLINDDKESGSKMLDDPIWQNIPAVQNGNIYEYPGDSAWLYTGPIANSQIIDDVLESVTE